VSGQLGSSGAVQEDFRRAAALVFERGRVFAVKLGGCEFTGAHVGVGHAGPVGLQDDGGQVVVTFSREEPRFDDRPGCDHPNDLPGEEAANRSIPHLFADRDVVALLDQA
jgi:hypothetical protein